MTTAVQVIWLEHVNISSVLACLRYLVDEIEAGRWSPDFGLLENILDYMADFPEALHHPKEEAYICAARRRRKPEAAPMLDKIHAEHEEGGDMLADLRARLGAYRGDPAGFADFAEGCRAYIRFERHHMAREERELLPLAARELRDRDWTEINRAFASNQDPLFGAARKKRFDGLYRQIVERAPGPMGFGAGESAR
jgi:branched-chain amino acid transport system ATP-binding protein